jgi:putative membrane protein
MHKLIRAAALAVLTALVAFLALATPALAQSPAGQQPPVSAATKKFVTEAAMTDVLEIEAGQIAMQKAEDAAYQEFAQTTIADHTATSEQIKGMLAKLPGVALPQQLDAPHRAAIDKLGSLSGAAFERMYKSDQLQWYRQAVVLFERYARNGDNAELKTWAANALPTLRKHLDHAGALPRPGQAPTTGSGERR